MQARAVLLVALLAACRTVPLADPPPVAGLPSPDLTRVAIHRALAREGFDIDEETPGRVRAHLHRRDWTMVVELDYAKYVAIRYVDSERLDYEIRHGKKYIHKGYNARAQRLADSVQREARLILAEVDPDAFLGQPPVSEPPPESDRPH